MWDHAECTTGRDIERVGFQELGKPPAAVRTCHGRLARTGPSSVTDAPRAATGPRETAFEAERE
jgi:hypothetical protein